MVRAKMRLLQITDSGGQSKTLHFATQYDESIPEDQSFTKATPWGDLRMGVDNPAALEKFQEGKTYYLDFTPAE